MTAANGSTSYACVENLRAALLECAAPETLDALLADFTPAELDACLHDWLLWARPDQLPPPGDWTVWLLIGGRGSGKTRAGAEWVRGMALGLQPFADRPVGRIALVGETQGDIRDVMIEGVSGILAVHPKSERPQWRPSRRRLEWPNGAIGQVFSAEDPKGLRGPQFDAAWSDELAKWHYAEATWDMLQFGLRLGDRPRQVVTTTPRPIPLVKRLMKDKRTVVSHASTRMNAANLAPGFLDQIVGRYAGTRLGRQELDGEVIEDRVDALWRRPALDALRIDHVPELRRVVVAVDPPASSSKTADACGIIVAGLDSGGVGYVLKDGSVSSVSPSVWAKRVVGLYRRFEADTVVAEVNQGGEMVTQVLREVEATVPVIAVRATRGKWLRAEPVAALYEQGRVRHIGAFPDLEDEMCDFGPDGLSSGSSPDRLDALVWALTALMIKGGGEPQVRVV